MNIHNCVEIFQEYCCKVLSQSLNLDKAGICEVKEEVTRDAPREAEVRKYLSRVHYPCPDGYTTVTLFRVNAHWGAVDVISLMGKRPKKALQAQRRRFLYTVVVEMHQKGYLTPRNEPSQKALAETKAAVEGVRVPSEVRLRDTFAEDSLPHVASSHSPATGSTSSSQSSTEEPSVASSHTPAMGSSSTQPSTDDQNLMHEVMGKIKLLQELMQDPRLPADIKTSHKELLKTKREQAREINARIAARAVSATRTVPASSQLPSINGDPKSRLSAMSQGRKGTNSFQVRYTFEACGVGSTASHRATVVLTTLGQHEARDFTSEWFSTKITAAQEAAAIAIRFCEESRYPMQSHFLVSDAA